MSTQIISKRNLTILIIVSSLGYFVDVYDLLLFSVIRKPSLLDLGVSEADSLNIGLSLLDYQMLGLIVGGILWGMFGDKKGRLSVLFGSIILYSIANILNGLITNVEQYKVLRVVAGMGLAGELGAGITLVSESMSAKKRGIGTMIVATVGLLGAVAASLVGTKYNWRTAFIVGGCLGLALFILRIGVYESGLYNKVKATNIKRGNFFQIFTSSSRFWKYIKAILVGIPTYFIVGILITGSPEFGKYFGVTPLPVAGIAVMICYIALSIGDICCSTFSQLIKRRKAAFLIFNVICLLGIIYYLYFPSAQLSGFYIRCFIIGFGCGFWALIATNAAEQFGTNLRATVTTTVPNFVRGALVPMTFFFNLLKPSYGLINSAGIVGITSVILALIAVYFSKETFGKDLDFLER